MRPRLVIIDEVVARVTSPSHPPSATAIQEQVLTMYGLSNKSGKSGGPNRCSFLYNHGTTGHLALVPAKHFLVASLQ
jgi:hypothetical protein